MLWLLAHLSGGYARHHPLRAIVQIIAIAVGVALGYAINLINASALDEFSGAVRHVLGEADFSVSGGRLGFDEGLYARIAALPEVDTASPIVEVEAPVPSMPRSTAGLATLKVIGVDVFRAAQLSPALIGEPQAQDRGTFALLDDGLYLSPAALERFRVVPGDSLKFQVGPDAVELRIAGRLPRARVGEEVAVLDIGAAQTRFKQVGRLHRIDVKVAANASPAAARDRIAALLPPGVTVSTPDEAAQRVSNVSRAYRVNLNVLALVALFTGAFLVFSLQAQAVVARRTELAFLRISGLTAGELQRWLVGEAAIAGSDRLGARDRARTRAGRDRTRGAGRGSRQRLLRWRPGAPFDQPRLDRCLLRPRNRSGDRRRLGSGARGRPRGAGAGAEGRVRT